MCVVYIFEERKIYVLQVAGSTPAPPIILLKGKSFQANIFRLLNEVSEW